MGNILYIYINKYGSCYQYTKWITQQLTDGLTSPNYEGMQATNNNVIDLKSD